MKRTRTRKELQAIHAKGTVTRKRKRKVSKRPKLNKDGFKTLRNQKVFISKGSSGNGWSGRWKDPPRPEVVEFTKDLWNNDPTLKKMKKNIGYLSIVQNKTGEVAGTWENGKATIKIVDKTHMDPKHFKSVVIHEINGHVYWDWARKWRREELVEFNKLANSLPPVNTYVKENEEEWKQWNDEEEDLEKKFKKSIEHIPEWDASDKLMYEYQEKYDKFKQDKEKEDYKSMTRYANEQHSAVTELMYDYGYHPTLIDDSNLKRLKDAWQKLHY